jgi:hypothetical protein
MAELMLDRRMNVGPTHRSTSHRQHVDDRSLHHAIAEPSRRRYEGRARPPSNRQVG